MFGRMEGLLIRIFGLHQAEDSINIERQNKKLNDYIYIYRERHKNNLWKEAYRELSTGEVRKRTVWWKIGVWRLNGIRRNNKEEVCPTYSSHMLRV
jgi:hypothetical protein